MMKTPLTFSKIVATPTLSSWSQAYNAGNLAAVISLVRKPLENPDESPENELSLQALGKELLNTLEAEYFTLETKNLTTIKQAITQTTEKVEGPVVLSLGVSVIIENVLYVFLYGAGTILMKRKDKLGTLLHQEEEDTLTGASGYIENGDIVILETPAFSQIVSKDVLLPCLEHEKISELSEVLSPVIHEKQVGDAAALAFSYQEEGMATGKHHVPEEKETPKEMKSDFMQSSEDEEPEKNIEEETQAQKQQETEQDNLKDEEEKEEEVTIARPYEKEETFTPVPKVKMSHTRRLLLTIAIIVILVFGASIYFSIKHQKEAASQALFQQTVPPAQKKYDEGVSLLDLNTNLAKTDFQDAKSLLNSISGKLTPNSSEEKSYKDLVTKVDTAIANASNANIADTKQVDTSTSPLLAALASHPDAQYVSDDDTTIYVAGAKGITAVSKKDNKEKTAITNTSDWKSLGGFGVYLGNYYVLDKQGGIIKYANGSQSAKSSYFSGTAPDLTNATDMAIDGSVWILSTDGTINKFTKGKQETFSITGLDKPLSHPLRLATGLNLDNMYILDTGNKRIVVIDKNGKYVAQYQSGTISQATALDVSEKNKTVDVLANGKVYQITLK